MMMDRANRNTEHCVTGQSVCWRHIFVGLFMICITYSSVCCRRYPARNAHAQTCNLWPVRLYNIFPRYLINGRMSEKSYLT